MRAGFEYFKNFKEDAKDFAELATTKLNMPFLVLTGEKASGTFLIDQARLVATNVSGTVVQGFGHWLIGGSSRPGGPGARGIPQKRMTAPIFTPPSGCPVTSGCWGVWSIYCAPNQAA